MKARHVAITSDHGMEVVTVFEEKVNIKQVKREVDGSFHMNTLHPHGGSYEYAEQKFSYTKGDKKR